MYLPKYLPPVKDTGIVGPAEGCPGDRVKMRAGIPNRDELESAFYVDADARTMRWAR